MIAVCEDRTRDGSKVYLYVVKAFIAKAYYLVQDYPKIKDI